MGKKEEYRIRRSNSKIFSYTDFHGRIFTACKECQNLKTCDHVDNSHFGGCMEGKIKDNLKQYL